LWLVVPAYPYQGKYAAHPEWKALKERTEPLRPEALQAAALALGMEIPRDFQVEVIFEDMAEGRRGDLAVAVTKTVVKEGKTVQRITLHPELYFGHLADLRRTLVHEMVHALLRAALGRRHRDLPSWAREGLAVWAAGQGEEKLAVNLSAVWHEEDPVGRLLNGLEGPHTMRDYAEDYLAFEFMEAEGGPQWVRRVVRELIEGATIKMAIQSVTGWEWTEFAQRARAYAIKRVKGVAANGRAEYRRAHAAYRAGRWEEVLNLFEGLLARDRLPCRSYVMYYRARTLQRLGRQGEAEEQFRALLTPECGPPLGGLLDDAAFQWAECAATQGFKEEAATRRAEAFRNYPFASWRVRRLSPPGEKKGTSDTDQDGFYYAKPDRSVREFKRSLESAVNEKDWSQAVDLMTSEWRPQSYPDRPLEMEGATGVWVGFSVWLGAMLERLPEEAREEVRAAWNRAAMKAAGEAKSPWDSWTSVFQWPGRLPAKEGALAKAGLSRLDEGDAQEGWPFIRQSDQLSLRLVGALIRKTEVNAPAPPLARRWIWKAPAPPSALMAASQKIWVTMKDGRLFSLDAAVGRPERTPSPAGTVYTLLPASRNIVGWKPSSLAAFRFMDVTNGEFWDVFLGGDVTAQQKERGASGRFFIWPGSTRDRLFLFEEVGGITALGEVVLHGGNPSSSQLFWSQWLGQVRAPMAPMAWWGGPHPVPTQATPRVLMALEGAQWVALHSGEALISGNAFTGAIEWIRQIVGSEDKPQPAAPKGPQASPPSFVPSVRPVLTMAEGVILTSVPTRSAVYAVDCRTGEIRWHKTYTSEPYIVGAAEGLVVVTTRDEAVAYALKDGAERWRVSAPQGARRGGEGCLGGGFIYLPWGRVLTIHEVASGKTLGSVERALPDWCSLTVDPHALYEMSDSGIAAWRSAEELDRLRTAWKEKKDVKALAEVAASEWLNRREAEALEGLVTWLKEAPEGHPDREVQVKRLADWVAEASEAVRSGAAWQGAWEAVFQHVQATKDAVVLWRLAREAERGKRIPEATRAYQALLNVAADQPVIQTPEGSSLTISLVVPAALARLKGEKPTPLATPLTAWRGPWAKAGQMKSPSPVTRVFPTPHGLVLARQDGKLVMVNPADFNVQWEVAVGPVVHQVQVEPLAQALVVCVPQRRLMVLKPSTGVTLQEYSLPHNNPQTFLASVPGGVAVLQAHVKNGKQVFRVTVLDSQGKPVKHGDQPFFQDLESIPSGMGMTRFAPVVGHGDRWFFLQQKGQNTVISAYRRDTGAREWERKIPSKVGQQLLGLSVVDDRLIALVRSNPFTVALIDQATGQTEAEIAGVPPNAQLIGVWPNRVVIQESQFQPKPQQILKALDFQGEVIWTHPAVSAATGETTIFARDPAGGAAFFLDIQTGERLSEVAAPQGQVFLLSSLPGLLVKASDSPTLTFFLPSK